ncbi:MULTISPECIES: hypothetical protein [unclassified Clostridium]|uniref:hypothetical protein n=1 Tax=unclassified Clostridium TaxID=2614128 RepID=UPI002A8293F0|nr:hypothetical protein [Clostridium sp.]MDY4253635.1 hypothetical protein [Clostridium sp.]
MDLKAFEFLAKEVPNSISDIREAMDLLSASIDSAIDKIGDRVISSYKNKNYKRASELSLSSEELNSISNKIQEAIIELDSLIDEKSIAANIIDDTEEINERGTPNYSDYLVDTEVEHNLYEDLTHKRPCAIKIEGNRIEVKDWKSALIKTINYLAKKDPDIIRSFVDNPKMNGKKRIYFSRVKLPTMIVARGIEDANIYIETNLSANRIRNLLIKMLNKYNISLSDYKIFLKADYSDLH